MVAHLGFPPLLPPPPPPGLAPALSLSATAQNPEALSVTRSGHSIQVLGAGPPSYTLSCLLPLSPCYKQLPNPKTRLSAPPHLPPPTHPQMNCSKSPAPELVPPHSPLRNSQKGGPSDFRPPAFFPSFIPMASRTSPGSESLLPRPHTLTPPQTPSLWATPRPSLLMPLPSLEWECPLNQSPSSELSVRVPCHHPSDDLDTCPLGCRHLCFLAGSLLRGSWVFILS